jgi:hypothetical protein
MSYIRSSDTIFSGRTASSLVLPTVEQFVLAARPEEPIACAPPRSPKRLASSCGDFVVMSFMR